MIRLRGLKGIAVFGVAALAVVACGNSTGGGSTTSKGEIDIASDFPTQGNDSAGGLPAQNGAQFAVQQAATVKGFTLKFLPFDDSVNGVHDPQKGAQNVQQMISNSKILGMVGPLNSNVAKAEIPVANRASLVMISPSNTNDCLTRDPAGDCTKTQGFTPGTLRPVGKNNYFRIATADSFQGPAMADYIFDGLKLTKVAVFSDNETFGKGVADTFTAEFTKKGGTITNRQDFDWKSTNDFRPFLNTARDKGAQAIYAGATSATKGCIPRAQSAGILPGTFTYTGPDGIADSQCIKDAGNLLTNMWATVAGGDATQNASAKATIDAYNKAFPKPADTAAYTFASYDCAKILVQAISDAIDANKGNMPSREQVLTAMGKLQKVAATTGNYTFDQTGDPNNPVIALDQPKGADWAFVKYLVGG